MSSLPPQDRASLCRFTFSDHRKCLTPRSPHHPHFCFFHARQESRASTNDNLSNDLSYFFSGRYLSANDLCAALGRLIPAVVCGDIKPRTASTLAYLAQTMVQAIQLAQKEYTYAFGTPAWAEEIRNNTAGNFDRLSEDNSSSATDSNSDSVTSDEPEQVAAPEEAPTSEAPKPKEPKEKTQPQPNPQQNSATITDSQSCRVLH